MIENKIGWKLLALFYGLTFMLIREWLVPIIELTNTGHLWLFMAFVGIAFILTIIKASWFISTIVKVVYVFLTIHYIFYDKITPTKETLSSLVLDLISNAQIIFNGYWDDITNPFRTLMFFLLLWMATYLVRYWIEVRKNIFLFYLMTIIFITIIDTFSPFSANTSIVRIMLIGLLLLGLLSIRRLNEKHERPDSFNTFIFLSTPLLVMILFSGVLANVMPKLEPIWKDPVPFLQAFVNGEGAGGSAKSGYDSDDTSLGGSFVQDDQIVFEAKVATKQYWKIETKNTYTTKGWLQETAEDIVKVLPMGSDFEGTEEIPADVSVSTAQLEMEEKFPFIVYPYGIRKVTMDGVEELKYRETNGSYRLNVKDGEAKNYSMEFLADTYSMKQLRDTVMDDFASVEEDLSQYLQLPPELPDRVRFLASEIVAKHESVYEKTKAIERYFGRNGFVYAQTDIAVPSEDEDYVDQFLFDTKKGYCDNYSTSMVVMLRAIDIPARWVKGFAPGETVKNEDGEKVYRITNNEAHSWVEAYIPGIGWMPFEPTIGFVGQNDIDYDIELDRDDPETPAKKEKEKQQEKKKEQEKKKQPQKKELEEKKEKKDLSFEQLFKKYWWGFITLISFLTIVSIVIYSKRSRWLPTVLIRRHRTDKNDWRSFAKSYTILLKQLDLVGLKRAPGKTLSDFAREVDTYYGGTRMQRLTSAYEKGLYGRQTTEQDWLNLKEVWEDLMKRTAG